MTIHMVYGVVWNNGEGGRERVEQSRVGEKMNI